MGLVSRKTGGTGGCPVSGGDLFGNAFLRTFPLCILLLSALLAAACGGGGNKSDAPGASAAGLQAAGSPGFSAQNNGAYGNQAFVLEDIFYGRPILDTDGSVERLVNPASLVEIDPITGFLLPGYPKVLFPGDDLETLYSLDLGEQPGQPYEPKVVPRNGALLAVFSKPVDPASLNLDADMMLTSESPIAVYDSFGRAPAVQVTPLGDRLVLNPVAGGEIGFPASPVLFDESGAPAADPEGFLKIVFFSEGTGDHVLRSTEGWTLAARSDLLGTPMKPVGANPGNRFLDFIGYDLPFNGFLPDLTPARIIREVNRKGIVGAPAGISWIVDPKGGFNTAANNGQGEWAGALVVVRPGEPTEEKAKVAFNTGDTLFLETFLSAPPAAGKDAYIVRRAEYFEPIPGLDPLTAVDPAGHPKDPNDPEDLLNSDLSRFLLFDEWNGTDWVPVDYPYGVHPENPIKAAWRISLRFSEPMDTASFRPYETFYVCGNTGNLLDPCFDTMHLGRVTSRDGQRTVSFEPVHEDQFGLMGGDLFRGFGNRAKDLRLVIRSIPSPQVLEDFYDALGDPATWPPEVVGDLDEKGVLGVSDLGGRPLGFPVQFFDLNDPNCILYNTSPGRGAFPPAVDFGIAMKLIPDPSLDETGTVVHRFMGLPHTAADPSSDPPLTGVVYNDHDNDNGTHSDNEIYGPRIAEFRLGLSGFLSGHPVEFIEHVFDDYNPPGPTSPSYPDPITKTPFGVGTPINAENGVRFQQIYRRGDCSPDVQVYGGSILDIVGLAWCPIGGNVTHSYIKKLSIAMCLSSLGIDLGSNYTYDEPDTKESGGIPNHKPSGLNKKYDSYRGTWGPNGPYPAPDNYKEENPPIADSNVYDTDGDGSLRDEWQIVLGSPIDFDRLHANPVVQYTDGRPYVIDQKNVFAPKNQGSQFNYYIAYPDFDNPAEHPGFGYDSSRGLLIDIRTDDNGETPVAITNGYAFHVGIQSSMLPRFRVYSRGSTPTPSTAPRVNVYAATDPFDEISPPKNPQTGAPEDTRSWNRAWDSMLASPGNYGDNSRYFMIFEYAKRVSTIESPLLRVKPGTLMTPEYLSPIIDPPLTEVPQGTNLTVWFRASKDKDGTVNVTDWALPEDIGNLNGGQRPFVQFRATFEANLQTGDIPIIDTLVIPYKK